MKLKHVLGTVLAGACLITGNVVGLDGKPVDGVAWVISMPSHVAYEIVGDEVLKHDRDWVGVTGKGGHIEAQVPQGAHLCLQFVHHNEYKAGFKLDTPMVTTTTWTDPACFTVPFVDYVNLADLLQVPKASAPAPKK